MAYLTIPEVISNDISVKELVKIINNAHSSDIQTPFEAKLKNVVRWSAEYYAAAYAVHAIMDECKEWIDSDIVPHLDTLIDHGACFNYYDALQLAHYPMDEKVQNKKTAFEQAFNDFIEESRLC